MKKIFKKILPTAVYLKLASTKRSYDISRAYNFDRNHYKRCENLLILEKILTIKRLN